MDAGQPRTEREPSQSAHRAAPDPHQDRLGIGSDRPGETSAGEPRSDPRAHRLRRNQRPQDKRRRQTRHEPDDGIDGEDASGRIVRRFKVAAVLVFFAITLPAGLWYAWPHAQGWLNSVGVSSGNAVQTRQTTATVTGSEPSSARQGPTSAATDYPVLSGLTADPAGVDRALQRSALFRLIKNGHADWYSNAIAETAKAIEAGSGESEATSRLFGSLAQLRRRHAGDVFSAPAPRLIAIASAFVSSLKELRGVSVDACFGFISNGEVAPNILPLFRNPGMTATLQRQLHEIFEAVDEGRALPRVYPAPRQSDYTILLEQLEARGWTQADMQLFSDSRALANAPRENVCRLVTEWFESQLAVKDSEVQLRLIADSLKPLIAG